LTDPVLQQVRGLARANRIVLSAHAAERMRSRRVQYGDVRHALVHAMRASPSEGDRWRVEGPDLDGDDLSVVLVLEDGIIVVTVF
jgi:hypothetical protein